MNLQLLLDMAADGYGDRPLVGARDVGLSGEALRGLASALARRLAGRDAVLYLAVNGPAFPVALFGAALAGVPLVPVNYRLGHEQLDALLANHPGAFGIADEGAAADALSRNGISSVIPSQLLDSSVSGLHVDAAETGAPAAIIYTSGTTSAPKGVVLRHDHLTSYVLGTVEYDSADESDAALVSVPPYHIAAVANVLSNLYAGRRAVVLERFEPVDWLITVAAERITNALVVPTMLGRILAAYDANPSAYDLSSLRSLAYGGAPMPARVVEHALTAWPGVDLVNAYGLTETSSTITVLGPDDHRAAFNSDEPTVRARLGSVGRVLPTVEVQIRDAGGQPLPAGEAGRIHVRGDQVSAEYAGSGRALDQHGWFDTRDEGWLDEAGYLFIGGRSDDTIIRGAENIAPAEIEDVLLTHPAVTDAVVLGVPHHDWGQAIEAAVVLAPDQDVDESVLRDHVRARLRSSKTPDHIAFWAQLPRTETGKLVRRRALEQLLADRPFEGQPGPTP